MNKSEQIKKDLYASNPKRIKHIEGVYECAIALRNNHFPEITDEEVAQASYMHDMTKEWDAKKHLELFEKYGVTPDEDGNSEKLFHARTAYLLAKHVYGLDDGVCSAIYYHTTGRANMTNLEKIIYLADYIEKNRTHIDCIDVRDTYNMLIERGDGFALERAIMYSLDLTLEDLLKKSYFIHPDTVSARNYIFLQLKQEK